MYPSSFSLFCNASAQPKRPVQPKIITSALFSLIASTDLIFNWFTVSFKSFSSSKTGISTALTLACLEGTPYNKDWFSNCGINLSNTVTTVNLWPNMLA